MSVWSVQLPAGPNLRFISLFFLPRRGPNPAGMDGEVATREGSGVLWKEAPMGIYPGGIVTLLRVKWNRLRKATEPHLGLNPIGAGHGGAGNERVPVQGS